MESGVSLSPWAVAQPKDTVSPLQQARILATQVGCGGDADQDNAALVECLRNVSVDTILNASQAIFVSINSREDQYRELLARTQ